MVEQRERIVRAQTRTGKTVTRRLAVAAMTVVLAACATNPVTGRREISLMSPESEAALGRQAAAEVERDIGLVRGAGLNAYVEAIGRRLAQHSPRSDVSYRFQVADMAEPNAFALPGGYIYVSRGLLALTNSEDELAGVIGHEIGHVAALHAAQRQTRAAGVGLLSILGTVAAGAMGGSQAAEGFGQLAQVAGAGLIASYGRDQERQADQVGQELAASGGWDPAGISAFLTALGREELLRTGHERLPGFLDSHPTSRERVQTTLRQAAALARAPVPPVAATRSEFLARIEGVRIGPNPREGVFRGRRFLHPGLGIALEFPEGWQTQNQKRAVAALSPEKDALLVLEPQGATGDPLAAARAWAEANSVQLQQAGALSIGGYAAFRGRAVAQGQQGRTAVEVTWIAHPSAMLRLTGMTALQSFDARAASFRAASQSFRPLSREERNSIHDRILRTVSARGGETLDALGRRTDNQWSPAETAVANGLAVDTRLRADQWVKIAVDVPLAAEVDAK